MFSLCVNVYVVLSYLDVKYEVIQLQLSKVQGGYCIINVKQSRLEGVFGTYMFTNKRLMVHILWSVTGPLRDILKGNGGGSRFASRFYQLGVGQPPGVALYASQWKLSIFDDLKPF